MKRFLIHLGLWLAALFLLGLSVDFMITKGLRKTGIRKYAVWNDIYNKRIDADLLVLGSSRACYGYNTYILDSLLHCNSYNLGIDGHHFDMQLIRYQTYRRFNAKPKLILLNTDFLSTLDNSAEMQYEREQFFPYIQDPVLLNAVAQAKQITWLDRHFPLIRYYGYHDEIRVGIASFLGRKQFKDSGLYKGYKGNNDEWNRARLDGDRGHQVRINVEVVNLLDTFVRKSNEEGVKLVFVKSPVYHLLMDYFVGIPQTDSIFASIAGRYGVPVLDYYDSPIGKDSTLFYNPSHLNAKGAELFTRHLCEDLSDIVLY